MMDREFLRTLFYLGLMIFGSIACVFIIVILEHYINFGVGLLIGLLVFVLCSWPLVHDYRNFK
jgi:hypothetical protein